MAYAIMRWVKVTSQKQADDATGHNARTSKVANADKEAPHPNIEFVITDGRGYWELATERIAQVVTRKVRDDQVRCMEVILTASPEFFERDANGRAVDMKDSQWAKDQLTFLEKTFGKENVLSCTLHQDEKSPHVHAVIAPITEDGHLSAKRLFNPITMTGYQTAYAEAMKPHGLARGVEHSQAEHQPMTRMYGQQKTTAAELGAQLGPVSSYQDQQVKRPGVKDYLNLSEWEAKTSAQVNEKARAQVEEANKRAEKAQSLALENAAAKDQVRVLQKQLSTSEELKEGHYGKLVDAAKRAAGGEPTSPALIEQGGKLLDKAVQDVQQSRERVVVLTTEGNQAEKNGDYALVASIRYGSLQGEEAHQKELVLSLRGYKGGIERLDELDEKRAKVAEKQAKLAEKQNEERIEKAVQDVRQNRGQLDEMREELRGQGIHAFTEKAWKITGTVEQRIKELETSLRSWKGGTERLDQLDAQMAQERTDKAKQQADEVYARAQDEARQKAENERQKPIVRENERQQIEQKCLHILTINPHIYSGKDYEEALMKNGVDVLIVDGKARLRLKGSENEFTGPDIRPGERNLEGMINERMTANLARSEREMEKERNRDQGQSM